MSTYPLTDDEPVSEEEEEAHHTHKKRRLKSCKIHTMDSLVVKKVKWPHEMVFTNPGQPPVYDKMSPALFMNGYMYLAILTEETDTNISHMPSHLQELMEDSEVYMG